MDAAFASGLEVTGLHNHFFYDEPKVYFMHIGGTGEPEKLAAGVKAVWDAIKKVRADEPARRQRGSPATRPKAGTIDAAPIEKVLGHKAQVAGRRGQGDDRPRGHDARRQGRRLDGADDLGGVLRQRRAGRRGRRLHHDRRGGPAGAAGAAQGGHPRRRPAQPHGRRAAGLLLHPLLGQGQGRGAGRGPAGRPWTPRRPPGGPKGTERLPQRPLDVGVDPHQSPGTSRYRTRSAYPA